MHFSKSDSPTAVAAAPIAQRRGRNNYLIVTIALSEAGRASFAASRARRACANDADRLRKYLARFGLEWARVCAG